MSDTDGLVQDRCNSSALAMELRLSCTNPLIWSIKVSRPLKIQWGLGGILPKSPIDPAIGKLVMVDYIYVEAFQILFWGLENSHASTLN